MKQGTIKTLGTVALGAAFVVTAAGVASAAPSVDTAGVLKSLPVKDAAKTVSGLTKAKPWQRRQDQAQLPGQQVAGRPADQRRHQDPPPGWLIPPRGSSPRDTFCAVPRPNALVRTAGASSCAVREPGGGTPVRPWARRTVRR